MSPSAPPALLPYMHCPACGTPCHTLNDFATHRLDAHERPLPARLQEPYIALGWSPAPRATRFVPPNYHTQGLREFARNGQEAEP